MKNNSFLIDNFIRGVTEKRMGMEVTLKRTKDKLRHIIHTAEFHETILKLDAFTYHNHLGIKNAEFHRHLPKNYHPVDLLVYRFAIPYMTEKLLMTYDNKSLRAKKAKNSLIDFLQNSYLAAGSITSKDGESILRKFSFFYGYDQIKLQQKNRTDFNLVRLIELYKPYQKIDEFLVHTVGLTLEKICVCKWVLFSFIMKHNQATVYFSITSFKDFATSLNITSKELDSFLNFILIDHKTFKNEYLRVRTDVQTGKVFDDEKLKRFDQFLPKVSFWYPLIKVNEDKMILLSYTALQKFLELDRLYEFIYNCKIPNFQSQIHGPAFERYVMDFIKRHADASVYGNKKYNPIINGKPSKRLSYDEPDVIVEFDSYVIFIECKSQPFNLLNALQNFDDFEFKKIEEDYNTSNNNIDRYIQYINSFDGKKIYRLMVYLFPESVSLSTVVPRVESSEMLLSTDIHSLEQLFSLKDLSYDKVLDEYYDLVRDRKISSLNSLLETTYHDNLDNETVNSKFKDYFKYFFKDRQ